MSPFYTNLRVLETTTYSLTPTGKDLMRTITKSLGSRAKSEAGTFEGNIRASLLYTPALLELNLLDYLCHCLSFESSAKQRCAEMHQLSTSLDHVFLDNPSQSLIPVLISRAFYISKQNDFGSRSHLEGLAKHCHEPGASGNLVS